MAAHSSFSDQPASRSGFVQDDRSKRLLIFSREIPETRQILFYEKQKIARNNKRPFRRHIRSERAEIGQSERRLMTGWL